MVASPSVPVLTYFPLPGRAEITRLLFAYGQVDFQDIRVSPDEYGATKSSLNLPFGQLPKLEVEGKTYGQSLSIARFAAKRVGLYPQDDLEALEADSIVDTISELYNATIAVVFGKSDDDDAKQVKFAALSNDVIPRTLANLEKRVTGPYFTGDHVTYADVYLLAGVDSSFSSFPGQLQIHLDNYPKLNAIVSSLRASDQLHAYYSAKK
jgi:glutathione S-transferase